MPADTIHPSARPLSAADYQTIASGLDAATGLAYAAALALHDWAAYEDAAAMRDTYMARAACADDAVGYDTPAYAECRAMDARGRRAAYRAYRRANALSRAAMQSARDASAADKALWAMPAPSLDARRAAINGNQTGVWDIPGIAGSAPIILPPAARDYVDTLRVSRDAMMGAIAHATRCADASARARALWMALYADTRMPAYCRASSPNRQIMHPIRVHDWLADGEDGHAAPILPAAENCPE